MKVHSIGGVVAHVVQWLHPQAPTSAVSSAVHVVPVAIVGLSTWVAGACRPGVGWRGGAGPRLERCCPVGAADPHAVTEGHQLVVCGHQGNEQKGDVDD